MLRILKQAVFVCAAMAVAGGFSQANAAVLYDNFPINGNATIKVQPDNNYYATPYSISGSLAVSNLFSPTTSGIASQVSVGLWSTLGNQPGSLTWSLSGVDYFGSELGSGTISGAALTNLLVGNSTPGGYSIWQTSFFIPGIALTAGNFYFLTLSHGADNNGLRLDWDTGANNPLGYDSQQSNGIVTVTNDPQTFRIDDTPPPPPPAVPEPSSAVLLLIGALGAGARYLRRKPVTNPVIG